MICNKCLKDKSTIEFQSDKSHYCNLCIKHAGKANLIPPAKGNLEDMTKRVSVQEDKLRRAS